MTGSTKQPGLSPSAVPRPGQHMSIADLIAFHNREATLTTDRDTYNWHRNRARQLEADSKLAHHPSTESTPASPSEGSPASAVALPLQMTTEEAAKALDAERDAAAIPYGDIAHWWRRRSIELKVALEQMHAMLRECNRTKAILAESLNSVLLVNEEDNYS